MRVVCILALSQVLKYFQLSYSKSAVLSSDIFLTKIWPLDQFKVYICAWVITSKEKLHTLGNSDIKPILIWYNSLAGSQLLFYTNKLFRLYYILQYNVMKLYIRRGRTGARVINLSRAWSYKTWQSVYLKLNERQFLIYIEVLNCTRLYPIFSIFCIVYNGCEIVSQLQQHIQIFI